MAEIDPGPDNDYQVQPTAMFSRELWNIVMASVAARLKARELLEASFEALITQGTQAALDMISVNVAPQLSALTTQMSNLEDALEELIGGGVAPNSLQLGGKNPDYYLALANATGTLPVAQVSGVSALIDAAVAGLVNGSPAALDTLKELSDALGGDANFAGSVAAALGSKVAKASNLSDLDDKDAALGNLLGGVVGIAVFKAVTKSAAREAIDAVSKTGDTITGVIDYGPSALNFINAGFHYEYHASDHVAWIKKVGTHNFYWRRNDTGLGGGENEVDLMLLSDVGELSLAGRISTPSTIAAGGSISAGGANLQTDGNIFGSAYGGYLTTHIGSTANAAQQTARDWAYGVFVQDIRLSYASDGALSNTTYADGPAGAVASGGHAAGNGSMVTLIGLRYRFLQKNIAGNWYTAAHV